MKATFRLTLIVISTVLFSAALVGTAMAAVNSANDGGGGGIILGGSGNVTVTSTQLGLVKAVYDSAGNCIASSDSDAACGGTSSVSVLTGTKLTFVLYVDNTTAISATDVRFVDNIDDDSGAGDYFQFQTQFTIAGCAAGQGMAFGTRASAGADKNNIYTAATGGTCLTNALDGSTQVDEYAGVSGASPAVLSVGGDASSPDNDRVDVTNGQVWAIAFDVIKLD